MIFTFLSFATCSTRDLVITITSSSEMPAFLRINRPHSFRAKAASSIRRFVARAMSARVQSTLTWVSAPPSSRCVVSNTRSVVNMESTENKVLEFNTTADSLEKTHLGWTSKASCTCLLQCWSPIPPLLQSPSSVSFSLFEQPSPLPLILDCARLGMKQRF